MEIKQVTKEMREVLRMPLPSRAVSILKHLNGSEKQLKSRKLNTGISVAMGHNVLGLCDVAVSKLKCSALNKMFNQGTNDELCTSPAILQNPLLCAVFI